MATNIAANNTPTKSETLAHSGHSDEDGAVRRGARVVAARIAVEGCARDRAELSAAGVTRGGPRCSHSPGIIVDGLRTVIL